MRRAALALLLALAALPANATVYEIGAGKTYTTIGAAPWGSLQPGDNVKIYPGTYHEKLEITVRGTQASPIVIEGIPDGSTLPVIDGVGATEGPNFNTGRSWQYGPGLGLVYFGVPVGGATKPGWVTLKNLRIQGANAGVSWTPNGGSPTTMTGDLSAVYIQTGENLTFEGLEITDSGNGFFANSNYGSVPEIVSRDILVRKCRIWGNGSTTSYLVHNVYTEADGIVFEYNWLGAPRANALGNNLKDRSQGFVFRYNWIINGGHIMDLVECQAGCNYFTASKYNEAWVYGNVIINSQADPDGGLGAAQYMIQFGAENNDGLTGIAGGGRDNLYFFHNTVVMYLDADGFFKVRLFDISDSGADGTKETVHIHNNLIVSRPYTTGHTPCPWYWRADTKSPYTHGSLDFGTNAVSSNWGYEFSSADTSNVTGAANLYSITSPTTIFTDVSLAAQLYSLAAGSEAIERAGSLPEIVSSGNSLSLDLTPTAQYVKHQSSGARTLNGAVLDAGAYEFDSYVAPTITTTQLPNGVRDAAYDSTTLAVSNGTAPYTWTVSAGSICAGLSLSSGGVISGTPTVVGTCNFTARVADATTANDTQALSITITAPPPSLSVSVTAGSGDAVVTFGLAGLAHNQSCFATIKNATTGAVVSQTTVATGASTRLATFTGLNAGGSYKAEATCGASSSPQTTFTTKATAGDATYRLNLKPPALTLAQMTAVDATLASATAAVYWQAPGEGSYTATRTACSSTCAPTKTGLASGVHSYYLSWLAGTAYATGSLNWTDASYPSDGETVTVGSITYTFRTTVAQPFDVKIVPDSTEASYSNLWEAIDYGNWTPGVSPNAPGANYYATTKNPDIVRQTWSAAGNTATFRAAVLGAGGNSIALSETSSHMTVTPPSGGTDAVITSSASRPSYVPIP